MSLWFFKNLMYFNVFLIAGALLFLVGTCKLIRGAGGLAAALERRRKTRRYRSLTEQGKLDRWPADFVMYASGTLREKVRPMVGAFLGMVIAIPLLYAGFALTRYEPIDSVSELLAVTAGPGQSAGTVYRLLDSRGAEKTRFALPGMVWFVEADFVLFPPWAKWVGLHSGVKAVRLVSLAGAKDLMLPDNWHPHELRGRDLVFWCMKFLGAHGASFSAQSQPGPLSPRGSYSVLAGRSGIVVLPRGGKA